MRIELGVPVTAADGQRVGRVRRLVVDPATGTIPYFILDRGRFAAELLVAVTDIAEIEESGALGLCLDASQVSALPRFLEADFVVEESSALPPLEYAFPADGALLPLEARDLGAASTPVGTPFRPSGGALFGARLPGDETTVVRSSLPEWEYQLGRGTEVRTSDGWQIGRVDAIELASNGRPQTLMVHSPFLHTPHRVPFAAITSGGPKRVVIGLTADQFLRQEAGEPQTSEAATLG